MRKILLLLIALPMGLQAQIGVGILETSGARLQIPTNGTLFNDVANQNPGYEVPLGSGNHTVFSSSIWIGGVATGGDLHLAGITYCESGSTEAGFCEYYPGPLKIDGTASTTEDTMEEYNRVWLVSREEADLHIVYFQCLNDPNCDVDESFPNGYDIPEDFTNWPAHGDVSQNYAADLAPFVDVDENGTYNPENGDYPSFCGDQAAFLITNDAGIHFESLGEPIGLEIHTMVYAYLSEGPLSTSVFIRQKLINRSGEPLEDTFVGVWNDFDIGNYQDDYVGTDVERAMVYGYNSAQFDADYGDDLPAMGCIILRGPLADANNTADDLPYEGYTRYGSYGPGWGDDIVDNETIGLSGSNTMFSSGVGVDMPYFSLEFYNYLSGNWKSGAPLVYGGTGYDGPDSEMLPTDYVFPGTSDPMHEGTGGIDPEDMDEDGWTEVTANTNSSDRKMLASMGPFTFESGSEEIIEYAYVFAQESQDPETPLIELLGINADEILESQCDFNADIVTGLNSIEETIDFSLFPNPSQGDFTLQMANEEKGTYKVFNIVGQEITSGKLQFPNTSIELSSVPSGMYFVNVKAGNLSNTHKILIEN